MKHNNLQREFFNSRAHLWDSHRDPEKLIRINKLFQKFGFFPQGNVLDVGCGTGILHPIITRMKKEPVRLFELDFFESMLKQGKEKFEKDSRLHTLYINADGEQLPFLNESIQWIIAFAVVPHLLDKRKAIREWYRVLDFQGTLVVLHLMGSNRLNEFHASAGEEVARDHLPPAANFSSSLQKSGYCIKEAIDQDDLYLIHAIKI